MEDKCGTCGKPATGFTAALVNDTGLPVLLSKLTPTKLEYYCEEHKPKVETPAIVGELTLEQDDKLHDLAGMLEGQVFGWTVDHEWKDTVRELYAFLQEIEKEP